MSVSSPRTFQKKKRLFAKPIINVKIIEGDTHKKTTINSPQSTSSNKNKLNVKPGSPKVSSFGPKKSAGSPKG